METASSDVSDLVGLTWAEAEPLLSARGLTYTTQLTAPPGKPVGIGGLRVVAQRSAPGTVTLIVAYWDYRAPKEDD